VYRERPAANPDPTLPQESKSLMNKYIKKVKKMKLKLFLSSCDKN